MRKHVTLLFLLALVCLKGWSQQTTQSTPGTYTYPVPNGVTSITVELWGAGGAGGGYSGLSKSYGGGGSGGGYVRSVINIPAGTTSYTFTVGAGGAGATGAGTDGGASWFGTIGSTASTATLLAVGGKGAPAVLTASTSGLGAAAVTTGNIAIPIGSTLYSYYGGAGATAVGASFLSGGGGGGAGTSSNGVDANGATGGAAGTGNTTGAGANGVGNAVGALGGTPGGGGSGAGNKNGQDTKAGGNGGTGKVVITACPTTFSLTSTTATTPICNNGTSTITLSSGTIAAGNSYSVTYNISGAVTANGLTATMNPTTAGTGTFTTGAFTNTGTTALADTITVTGITNTTKGCVNTFSGNTKATVIVNPTTTITSQPLATQTVCQNTAATALSITATGTALTYQWFSNTTNSTTGGTSITNATASTFTPSTATAGTTYYYVVVTGSCGTVTSSAAQVIVTPTATVTKQPTGATYCQNTSDTALSVSATGTGTLAYQWFSNTTNSNTGGTAISGATAATYTPSTTAAGTTYYYVTVTGSCATTTSNTAAVVVNATTAITTQPTGATYCQNASDSALSVSATGTGLTYQWYFSTTNSTSYGTAVGGNSSTFTPSTTTAGTLYYFVRVTGSCGSVMSNTAAVVVTPLATITKQPTGATYCLNATDSALSVTATGTGTLSYQWFSNTTNSNTGGTAISGANTSSFTPTVTTAGTTYYYVTVTGSCATTTSNTAAVVVNPATSITAQPSTSGQTLCQNTTATSLSVTATGGNLAYQWFSNTTNSNTGGTAISGANTSTFTPSTSTAGTTYYYVVVTGGCSPTSVTSNVSGAINVSPATAISTQPIGATYCQNASDSALSVSATGTGTLSYQWYYNTTNSTATGTAAGGNSSTFTPSTTTAGTLYYFVRVTGSCGSILSNTAAVVVTPLATITKQPTGATYCLNATDSALSVTATGTGTLSYQWFSNTTNSNTGGTAISGANTSSFTPTVTTAGTTYYYVTVTGTCATTTSNTAAVVVNATTAINTQPTGATYCQNVTDSALSVTATGTSLTYQWFSNTTNSTTGGSSIANATNSTFTPSTSTAGTTYYYVVVTGSCGTVTSTTAAVVVTPAATITGQPTGATYCVNATATALSVTATGTGTLSYQWFSNTTNNNTTGTAIANATASTFTPSTTTAGTTYYYVKVTGSCATATSNTAAVVVNATTTITGQPTSATYCVNTTATALSVTATGTGTLSYQWFSNTTNSTTGGASISGQTNSTFTPSTTTVGTTYYYVVVSSSCGTATSNIAAVVVNATTVISGQPSATQTVCQNATATTLSVTATGTALTYQWFSNTTNSTTGGSSIANATNSTFTPSTSTAGTTYYYVVVTGSCGTVTSNTAQIVVNPATTITVQPLTTQTICQNGAATLSVTATGTGTLTYQWFSSTTNNNTTGTAVPGNPGKQATYTPTITTAGTTYYFVKVMGTCGTVTSNTAQVVVNATTVISGQPSATQTVCQNATATTLSVTATGTALTYQWFSNTTNSTTGGSSIANATNSTFTPSTSAAGTTYYYVVVTGSCGTVTSTTAAVVVNATTAITAQPTGATYCQSATATALSVSTAGVNLTYQWFSNTTNANTGGTSISGANTSTFTPADTTIGTTYYYVVVTGSCGTATSNTAQIVVNATTIISGQPTGATYCLNTSDTALSVSATGTGTITYQWFSNTTNSTTGAISISGQNNSTFTPSTSTAGTTYYFVKVMGTCGTLTSNIAAVTINQPSADPTSATASVTTICNGASTILTLNGGGGGTGEVVKWYTGSCGGTVIGTGNNFSVSPTATTTYYGRYEDAAPCNYVSACASVTITVNNLPSVAHIIGPKYLPRGQTISLVDSTAGGIWSIDNTTYATLSSSTANPVNVTGLLAAGTPTISYTITDSITHCNASATKILILYDPTLAHYLTNQDGNFSNFAIWNINRNDGNGEVAAEDVPDSSANITVRHNLMLDQNYYGGSKAIFVISTHLDSATNTNISGTLTIMPNKSFSSAGGVDFGNRLVTVQSDATGTGSIGAITNATDSIANASNVTVERYFGSAQFTTSRRAWQLITAPVNGVTINNSWQEELVRDTSKPAVGNPKYGTLITGHAQMTSSNAYSHGYDFWNVIANKSASILRYKPAPVTGSWDTLPDPGLKNLDIESYPAYLLFVRGNRSVLDTGHSVTTLRANGFLNQGPQVTSIPGSGTQAYTLLGNPYASPIDFEKIYTDTGTNGILHQFTIWNSNLGNYGAYELVSGSVSGYTIVPYPFTGNPIQTDSARYIPSGAGFFVQPVDNTGGKVTIDETAKASTQTALINPFRLTSNDMKLYVNLNLKNSDASTVLADGVLARFNNNYSNNIDASDASKQTNLYENLGILSHATNLMLESRPDVTTKDTIQLKLWNVSKRVYQLQLKADGFDTLAPLHAWLEDKYLQTKQPVSLTGAITSVDFTINSDAASFRTDRFRILFQNDAVVLPVTITEVKANAQNGGVAVNWTVANEVNVKDYTVERSTDGGKTFIEIATVAAVNQTSVITAKYNSFDALPKAGDNLYRIKMVSKDGSISYSSMVLVNVGTSRKDVQIAIYPNPVTEGKVNMQLSNLTPGTYLVSVYSVKGQQVYNKEISVTQAGSTQSEQLLLGSTLAQGSYQLHIADENGKMLKNINIIIAR